MVNRGGDRLVGAALAALCMVLLAACGGGSSGTASGSASAKVPTTVSRSGGCGTLPAVAADDPSGVLRTLGSQDVTAYQGFREYPLAKSAWADWKPARASGWNVQVVWQPLSNPLTNGVLDGLKKQLNASGKVATIQVQAISSGTDVPHQLQMIQTAIQRRPDLLIVWPTAPSATAPLIAQAARQGIPTVSAFSNVSSEYAVSVNTSTYLSQGLAAAGVLGMMGGKGSVLEVHGVTDDANDSAASKAWKSALSRCPGVKVAGSVEGQFQNSVAKTQVRQFLATHPSGVQGVFQTGSMGLGVLQAFTQMGRTPPALADAGTAQGTLAYWHAHPDYNMVGVLTPNTEVGQAVATVALRMLRGDGVKINTILAEPYIVSRANLADEWKASYEDGSQLAATPPAGRFLPSSYLDGFFNRSGTR